MCGEFDLDQRPAIPATPNRANILRALLIGTPIGLETDLTHSQQTRKYFLIGTIRPTLTPAPRFTYHLSLITRYCLAPFLFDTNKPHKIIILVSLPMKTKAKPHSIRHKFALRGMGLPAEVWPGSLIAGEKILKAAATR